MDNLAKFISSPQSNAWLTVGNMSVYVRKGHHPFNDEIIATIDIANVSVPSKYQNQGTFTRFLEDVESLGLPVYIENVLTPRFADFFRKRGYDTVSARYDIVSFLRLDDKEGILT